MSRLIDIIQATPDVLYGDGVSDLQIKQAEEMLGLHFSVEYKEYLRQFGALAFDSHEITGLIGDNRTDVVSVTRDAWKENITIPHDLYVIEDTAIDTIMIWQNEEGCIFQTTWDSKPTKIANSLLEFLL